MLSSKVLTPWLSKPGTWPLTNAEAFEPAPGCDGGATFAWVGSVLGFARSTPVGASGVLGSSDAMAVGTDTDAGGGCAFTDACDAGPLLTNGGVAGGCNALGALGALGVLNPAIMGIGTLALL